VNMKRKKLPVMNISVILLLSLGFLCCLPFLGFLCGASCDYNYPGDEYVDPGEEAVYKIRITNNDPINYPAGVTVRTEVHQDISDHHLDHETIHLELNESRIVTVTVFTEGITVDEIVTMVEHYEQGDTETEERFGHTGEFITTIRHTSPQDEGGKEEEESLPVLLIVAGGLSFGAFMVFTVEHYKEGAIPFLSLYSKLKRERILENPARQQIYETLCNSSEGASLTQLQRATGLQHKSYLHYHLRKLMEHGYLKRSGKLYFVPALQRVEANGNGNGSSQKTPDGVLSQGPGGFPGDGQDEKHYQSEYYEQHREKMIKTQKSYYERNKEKRREYQREYYHKTKESEENT